MSYGTYGTMAIGPFCIMSRKTRAITNPDALWHAMARYGALWRAMAQILRDIMQKGTDCHSAIGAIAQKARYEHRRIPLPWVALGTTATVKGER